MDGWPQLSDAVVDYYFDKKLAYQFIKRSQAAVCMMIIEAAEGGLELVVSNDSRTAETLVYSVQDIRDGSTIASGSTTAEPDAVVRLGTLDTPETQTFYVMEWTAGKRRGINHFLIGEPPYDLTEYQGWLSSLAQRAHL